MQNISKKLYSRPLINRDVFYGGSNEGIKIKYNITYSASLFDILKTYSSVVNTTNQKSNLTIAFSQLYSVDQAIERLKQMLGSITEWTNFLNIVPKFHTDSIINKSSLSSNFVASLELAKNGLIEVKQDVTFGNIFIRSKN